MPTYEYRCGKCGNAFERFQQMTDSPVKRCPKCGEKAERLIGAGAGVILKGSGNTSATRCGKSQTCCGRDTPCDTPPCKD